MGICKHAASDECNFAVEAEEVIEVVEFRHDARAVAVCLRCFL